MALQEPTTVEIRDILIASIEARLGQTIPILPKAVWRVLASVIAALFITLYKYGSWIYLQAFPQTAAEIELERWGDLIGRTRSPAIPARLEIGCTGENGQKILTGSKVINNLTGVVYLVDSDATIAAGVATTTMIAQTAGDIGNVSNGKQLSFVTPLLGIDNTVTITDTIVTGVNKEDLDIYRARVVDRFRKQPQGGAFADYEEWGEEVPTINNAYPYAGDVEGTVLVFVESSVEADGIPTAGEITQVEDSINQPDRRPVTAEVFVLPIIRTGFTVNVLGLVANTPSELTEAKDSITTFLTQFFLGREPFVEGLSVVNKSKISKTEISSIVSLSIQTKNAEFNDVTFEITGTGDLQNIYNLGQGEKAKLDNVVYS